VKKTGGPALAQIGVHPLSRELNAVWHPTPVEFFHQLITVVIGQGDISDR